MEKNIFKQNYYQDAVDAAFGSAIFPFVIMAAAAVESAWGESGSAKNHNNFFGVKPGANYSGKIFTLPTHEVVNDKIITINAAFRSYDSATECFKDYVSVLQEKRYIDSGVENSKTEEDQINAIAKGGYSTSPTYAHLLISVLNGLK